MSKAHPQPDVLVLGSHPACFLAGALLQGEGIPALLATIPEQSTPDRLVLVNPKFFELNKLTAALKKMPELTAIQGLKFLHDDAATSSEYVSKSPVAYIAPYEQIRSAMVEQAKHAKLGMIESKSLEVHGADESGVDLTINGQRLRPKMLLVGGDLPAPQRRTLGLPEAWDVGVLHRYTFLRCKTPKSPPAVAATVGKAHADVAGSRRAASLGVAVVRERFDADRGRATDRQRAEASAARVAVAMD